MGDDRTISPIYMPELIWPVFLFAFVRVSRLITDPGWFYPFYIWYFRQDHAIEGAKFLSARCCHEDQGDAMVTTPRRTRAFMLCLTPLYTLLWERRWQKG
ncbi:hypothetical protein C8029_04505 [Roseobacter sp. TSBP12]|nr:hypothetical protein C8029_04505 [Roseobacter sp. TSBP12]